MNQELMTLDFWQDTVIYEGKTFPVGMLACDALNVPADTISRMNEQKATVVSLKNLRLPLSFQKQLEFINYDVIVSSYMLRTHTI